jgi:Spy/CpxP family protein refolding chaperone
MCKSVVAIAAVVCMGLASWAVAQDSPKAQAPQGQEPTYLAAGFLARELTLTDAQKEQVEQIMRKARVDAQQASEPQARQQIFHAAVEQIGQNVLTQEQREKFRQLRQRRMEPATQAQGQEPPYLAAGFLARELKLTDAQHEQVEQIMRKARVDAQQAVEQQAKERVFQAAKEQISKNVLTDEQRGKFAQLRQHRMEQTRAPEGQEPAFLAAGFLARELKLTDAQHEQVEQIMRKARADAQQTTELQTMQLIFQKATERISKDVLTEEQRAKFKRLRQQRIE